MQTSTCTHMYTLNTQEEIELLQFLKEQEAADSLGAADEESGRESRDESKEEEELLLEMSEEQLLNLADSHQARQ